MKARQIHPVSVTVLFKVQPTELNINWASCKHVCNIHQESICTFVFTLCELSAGLSESRRKKKPNSKSLRAGFKSEPKGGCGASEISLFETRRF